ncbi:TatD family hydrolase [Candidatus Falkowbacteria bacterium]|nr:TatD family hydrolase [Candidatus Falkowbacteria bacterium]
MLIDAHAHLNFHAYKKDREEVIKRCQNMKVINIGSQFPTSRLALELAKKNQNMYASVGLHPVHVLEQERDKNEIKEKIDMSDDEQLAGIRELLKSDKDNSIVAIGETGLDYFHIKTDKHSAEEIKQAQKDIFIKHIELAQEFKKPLMLHCRDSKESSWEAYQELLSIVNSQLSIVKSGMIHCFSSSVEIAQRFVSLGFSIGITGIVTFPNAGELVNVVKETPLDRLLTETDCPYLAPQPVRGERNEPPYVEHVAKKIAEIKGISYDDVITAVETNAKKLFNI